ncbi:MULTISPECIES: DUF1150 domain-containing protein [Microbaculum]|uniref:DUF1150 domain-containing protein n=1 Tax=Microbaculum marinisediminis TaxID=2931392 RepID=A0AAW5R3P1_9HYPH|nr:DUF1150 domain-containing protein [Microbaculum sp. A6E488]MCT8973273.1 DUF1150 domain-containing protein [Microbaculum sp. A6E488]
MERNANRHDEKIVITEEMLANMGGGEIAYVKPIMSDVLKQLFPDAPDMAPGIRLFMLNAADGTPIMLTDSQESAVAGAKEHELETVSVH